MVLRFKLALQPSQLAPIYDRMEMVNWVNIRTQILGREPLVADYPKVWFFRRLDIGGEVKNSS